MLYVQLLCPVLNQPYMEGSISREASNLSKILRTARKRHGWDLDLHLSDSRGCICNHYLYCLILLCLVLSHELVIWKLMIHSLLYIYIFYIERIYICMPSFIALCFIEFCRYCVFYKLKFCGNPAGNKSIGTIFPRAFSYFVSVPHLVILTTLLLFLLWWSVISDLWCYYFNCFSVLYF